jgi:N6-L-threonylcarbamoyladenine synthase
MVTMMKPVLILGIESSCDETSCSVVQDGRIIMSNIIASQADLHAVYGGVVPEIASRMHVEAILPTIRQALTEAGTDYKDLSAVSVTKGPGLVGALLVGVSAAKGICEVTGLPMLGVGHIEGHICANYLADHTLRPPFVCLVVSGGHSHIVKVSQYTQYEVLGRTRDDAAGEAFDKIARAIGLGYPGGPKIDRASQGGDIHRYIFPRTRFPDSFDYSFSGIKTAALNRINQAKMQEEEISVCDFAASFQHAVVKSLVVNAIAACKKSRLGHLCLAGGVSANTYLRSFLQAKAEDEGIAVHIPPPVLCTDNAAMIASAGFYRFQAGQRDTLSMNAEPSLRLG